jgi:hypothetical protein
MVFKSLDSVELKRNKNMDKSTLLLVNSQMIVLNTLPDNHGGTTRSNMILTKTTHAHSS